MEIATKTKISPTKIIRIECSLRHVQQLRQILKSANPQSFDSITAWMAATMSQNKPAFGSPLPFGYLTSKPQRVGSAISATPIRILALWIV